jgi:orotidine-5'-phosphate decarboxylase
MTAVAYQGLGSLSGPFALAAQHDKGVIVVTATSNPESIATQAALRADGRSVAAALVEDVRALPGTAGLVIGATLTLDDYGLAPSDFGEVPILSPGFGAQGAHFGDLGRVFGGAAGQVAVHLSRELLGQGADGVAAAIAAAQAELRGLA